MPQHSDAGTDAWLKPWCWVQDAWGNAQDYALNAGDAAFLTLDGTVYLMGLAASSFQTSINSTVPGVHQLQAGLVPSMCSSGWPGLA